MFLPFLEITLHFEHFEKMIIVKATLFRKLETVKHFFRPLSKKDRFRLPFDCQHVKGTQTLVKYA